MDRRELAAWLRLLNTPGLGRATLRTLLRHLGSPQAVCEATLATLQHVVLAEGRSDDLDVDVGIDAGTDAPPSPHDDEGRPHADHGPTAPPTTRMRRARSRAAALAAALSQPAPDTEAALASTIAWLGADVDAPRRIIAIGDPRYPASLLESADPPLLLYAVGRIEMLGDASIAVVGSRNPTAQGLLNARAFAAHLSREGLTIVSGLALGIDGEAHLGGLEGRGSTIAVVGTGLDRVYPKRHLELARRIAADGLLLTEFALGTPPMAAHFPQRNRIIAGLARGTLVVEAALASGSLITARLALDAGREVFAIPGSIHSPQSRGCNALIKQGAKLVDRAEDILEELRPVPRAPARAAHPALPEPAMDNPRSSSPSSSTSDNPAVASLLDALGFDPMTLDELVSRTGQAARELSGRLLELELDGRVARMPGQRFQRVERA